MAASTRLTPEQRTLRAQLAAHTLHAGPNATTEKARAAFLARFEREADPDGTLSPKERRRRAEHLRKAHMLRLALASSKARAKKAKAAKRAG